MKQVTYLLPGGAPGPIQLDATFDSTHFGHGSTVTVRFEGTNSVEGSAFAQNSAPVYNKAYVLGNNTLTQYTTAANNAAARLGPMNRCGATRRSISRERESRATRCAAC